MPEPIPSAAGDAGQNDDLNSLLREAENALGSGGSAASEKWNHLRERLRRSVEQGRHGLDQAAGYAKAKAGEADEMVRANPYAAIGIAAGAGILLGYLLSRKCCRD